MILFNHGFDGTTCEISLQSLYRPGRWYFQVDQNQGLRPYVSSSEGSKLIPMRAGLTETSNRRDQNLDEALSGEEDSLSNLDYKLRALAENPETTKEDLQSIIGDLSAANKELQTLNSGLRQQSWDYVQCVMETVREPLALLDNALRLKKANRAFCETFCLAVQETATSLINELGPDVWNIPGLRVVLDEALSERRPLRDFQLEHTFTPGGRKILCINARRVSREMLLMSIEDITTRHRNQVELLNIQNELRQGQKMEAVGRLVGGVAHDFNNMLTAILGFNEMLMESLGEGTAAFQQALEVKHSGERAATLTQQLLAFSRRQVLQPQVLSLNTVIRDINQMLRRLLGDGIVLDKTLHEDLWLTHADPSQLSQVILNLTLNARDAMPHGGVLTIRTGNTFVNETREQVRGLLSGSYVTLTVEDSGTGMDQTTQEHLFEPFFTTKPEGLGTGLGLATVRTIVEQTGGSIQFVSELNRGTTFWVDFPRVEGTPATKSLVTPSTIPRGTETVLVVEDEIVVRGVVIQLLKRQGYTVLEARQGREALALCQSHPTQIDLLLTDIVLPDGLNGRQVAERAVMIRPSMRVVLMSGYTTDELVHHGVKEGVPFLQKPFSLQQLALKVREALDMVATPLLPSLKG